MICRHIVPPPSSLLTHKFRCFKPRTNWEHPIYLQSKGDHMSTFINITELQKTTNPIQTEKNVHTQQLPDTSSLRTYFQSIFDTHEKTKTFVVRSQKPGYELFIERTHLTYKETLDGHTKEICYTFETQEIQLNKSVQEPLFVKKLLSRLRGISDDISEKKAIVYEDLL